MSVIEVTYNTTNRCPYVMHTEMGYRYNLHK